MKEEIVPIRNKENNSAGHRRSDAYFSWTQSVGAGYDYGWNPDTFRSKHTDDFLNWLKAKGINPDIALKDYRKMDDKEKEKHSKLVDLYEKDSIRGAYLSNEFDREQEEERKKIAQSERIRAKEAIGVAERKASRREKIDELRDAEKECKRREVKVQCRVADKKKLGVKSVIFILGIILFFFLYKCGSSMITTSASLPHHHNPSPSLFSLTTRQAILNRSILRLQCENTSLVEDSAGGVICVPMHLAKSLEIVIGCIA